jgi:hypothetical protein
MKCLLFAQWSAHNARFKFIEAICSKAYYKKPAAALAFLGISMTLQFGMVNKVSLISAI